MRQQLLLLMSIGLSVVLALMLFISRRSAPVAQAASTNSIASGTNQGRTHVVVRKQFFAWKELESADYQAYLANLRDIGCPEQTIRDIIIADVNELYARKRLAEVPTADQVWWQAEPDTNFVQEASAKIAALDQERRTLLETLLGPNWESTEGPPRMLVALYGPVLGDLSQEAKNSVQEIIARSQERTQAYVDAQKAAGKPVDTAQIARLGQQMRTELGQVLNPAQMDEFLLRYSDNAAALREQLRGIEVTPEEFKKLFHLVDPLEQQIQLAGGNPQTKPNDPSGLGASLLDALKSVLGPERFEVYREAQDPLYRDAVTLAEDAGAPLDVVQKLYQLNQATAQEQNRIRNDPTLSDQQKTDALKALELQQQTASDALLGLGPPAPPAPPADNTPAAPPVQTQVHPYSPGETVDMIAAMYGVTPRAIFNANPDVNFNNLTRGASITIPPPPAK